MIPLKIKGDPWILCNGRILRHSTARVRRDSLKKIRHTKILWFTHRVKNYQKFTERTVFYVIQSVIEQSPLREFLVILDFEHKP